MFPFWGLNGDEVHISHRELFQTFTFDTTYYGITDDITKADAVFPPYPLSWITRRFPDLLEECARVAREAELPLFIDGFGDGEPPVGIENSYVVRYGGYRFMLNEKHRFLLPPHIQWEPNRIEAPTQADDLLLRCAQNQFHPRQKTHEKPSVGFAGQIRTTFKNMLHERLNEMPLYLRGVADDRFFAMSTGIFWRSHALRMLERSDLVACNFKARNFYSVSPLTPQKSFKELQKDFVDIILGSDYALDVRGFGNASVRLFEILSLGRIPVILDTERILPFSEYVDYKKFSLIIDFRDIKRMPEIIADFHASLTPQQFEDMQRAARDAYVKYFRVDAQMPLILREINLIRSVYNT